MTSETSRSKRGIPFLSTKITTDIILFFALIPIWTALGITQFFGPVLMAFLFIKLLITSTKNNTPIKIPFLISTLMGLFLLSSLISGLFIQESYWGLVFIRNFIVYLGAFALVLIIINSVKTKQNLIHILWALTILSFFAGMIGLLGLLDTIPAGMKFVTPISKLLPESIRTSEYLRATLYPSISGYYQEIFGLKLIRISSIFLFPNIFAAAILILFPYQFFLFVLSKGWKKLVLALNSILLLVCLIFTYSRSAILGIFLGFLYFIHLQGIRKKRQKSQRLNFLTVTVVVLVIFLILIIAINTMTQIKPLSVKARTTILKNTIQSWKESPVFGWGTQRNMEVIGETSPIPPLGSHSTYLSFLYRYGLSGFILYIAMIVVLFTELKRSQLSSRPDSFWKNFSTICGWIFFGNLVQAIFIVMDYDVVILLLIWMNWGFILVARRMLEKEEKKDLLQGSEKN